MGLRLGLIARCETARGLAIQSKGIFDALDFAKVLLVRVQAHKRDCDEAPEWYPNAQHVTYDHLSHTLPQEEVMAWLEGLDVVFSVETTYDWRLPDWARSMRVRTVIQGNPEFYRHDQPDYAHQAQPDCWWWPTTWRLDRLPPGRVVPVPMPDIEPTAKVGGVPRFLHVVGKRAFEDRNGTDIVINALRSIEEPCDFTINGFGWELPEITLPLNSPVRLSVERAGVQDRWSMYRDQSLLVLPRRYGGLCLDAKTPIDLADGLRIPIAAVLPGDLIRDLGGATRVTAKQCRTVPETVSIKARGPEIVSSTDHRHMVADRPLIAALAETKASEVRPGQWVFIARPQPEGIESVVLGPKPVRKGLRNWREVVELDDGWMRVLGLWLAEGHGGWYARAKRERPICELTWSFGYRDRFLADEVVETLAARGVRATTFVAEITTGFGVSKLQKVRCRSELLGRIFDQLGAGLREGARGKRAPDVAVHLVPALISGWLDGDGNDHGGHINGWSRSVGMISDFWRLLGKAGICGSITHGGERLDINSKRDTETVAGWCHRLKVDRVRTRSVSGDARPVSGGWMARIKAVEHRLDSCEVVSIETESGTYLASDTLTHNCLPALEAAVSGLGVLMPDTSPNMELASGFISARDQRQIRLACGLVHVADVDFVPLGKHLTHLLRHPEEVAAMQRRSLEMVPRWSEYRALYEREFEMVANR